jgi:hypothetical protein
LLYAKPPCSVAGVAQLLLAVAALQVTPFEVRTLRDALSSDTGLDNLVFSLEKKTADDRVKEALATVFSSSAVICTHRLPACLSPSLCIITPHARGVCVHACPLHSAHCLLRPSLRVNLGRRRAGSERSPLPLVATTERVLPVALMLSRCVLSQYVLLKGDPKEWLLGTLPPGEGHAKAIVYSTERAILIAVTPKDTPKYVGKANHTVFLTADCE